MACAKTHSSSLELQNTVWEMLYYEIGDFLAYKQLQPWAVFAPSSLRIPLTCTYHLLYSNPVSSAFSRPLKPHIFAHVIHKHHKFLGIRFSSASSNIEKGRTYDSPPPFLRPPLISRHISCASVTLFDEQICSTSLEKKLPVFSLVSHT